MDLKYYLCFLFLLLAGSVHHGKCHQIDSSSSEEDSNEFLLSSEEEAIDILIPGRKEGEFDIVISGDSSPSFGLYADEGDGNCGPARNDTNQYVDKILQDVRPKIPQLLSLPGRNGRFSLENGTLFGLPTLTRIGVANVRCSDDSYSFNVPMGLQNLTAKYRWQWNGYFRQFQGAVDMVARNVEADVLYRRFLPTATAPGAVKALVERLTITRLEGIRFNFEGLGRLDDMASRFTTFVATVFRRGISRALEGPVKNVINTELLDVEKYEQYYRTNL